MNIKAIQDKLDLIQNPKKGNSSKNAEEKAKLFWKPALGKHLLRFVPLKTNPENPFIELYFHYQFGKRTIISPINFGEKDPMVEFAKNLGKSSDPEDWKLAKKIKPKMRVFAPVIVRGEEDKGVRFYEFGTQIYTTLMGLAADEEIGDFTDVMNGLDFKLDVVQGATYKESTIRPAMKQSPLSKDSKLVEEWLNNQPDPIGYYSRFTFDEIKGFLEDWLNPDKEETVVTTEKANAFPSEPGDVVTASTKKRDIVTENEFDELFK